MKNYFTQLGSLLKVCVLITLTFLMAASARAEVFTYTSSTDFFAKLTAMGAVTQTLTFDDSQSVPSVPMPVTDGDTVGPIKFENFNFNSGGSQLLVTDTNDTYSGQNFLGMNYAPNFYQIFGGDTFDMSFGTSHAIGFFIISDETPNVGIFDDDIQLNVPNVGTAKLVVANVEETLGDGGRVYFLGVVDDTVSFTKAEVQYAPAAYLATDFTIDNIVIVPEPSTLVLAIMGISLLSLGLVRRRSASRRRKQY